MDSPERTNVRRRRPPIHRRRRHFRGARSGQRRCFSPSSSPFAGFLLDRGRYATIEARNPRLQVVPAGINEQGEIVGEVIVDNSKDSGFVRDKRGRIRIFDIPGARGTEAHSLNNQGQIVGAYSEDAPLVEASAMPRAFLLDREELIRIDVPDATLTIANGINERGQVVGFYVDAAGTPHGFRWHEGRFTTIDFPGAPATSLTGINNRGQIVGVYGPTTEPVLHGFLLSGGAYATFDAPGVPVTTPLDINDRGQIVGSRSGSRAPSPSLGRADSCSPGAQKAHSHRSISLARPSPPPAASTTAAGSSAPTRTPTAAPDRQPSPMQMPMMMMMMPAPLTAGPWKAQLREGAQHDFTRGDKRSCSRAPARRACWIPMSGRWAGLTARPPLEPYVQVAPHTAHASASAYEVARGWRPGRHQRWTSGWVMSPVAGSRRTTMLVLSALLEVRIEDRFAGRAPARLPLQQVDATEVSGVLHQPPCAASLPVVAQARVDTSAALWRGSQCRPTRKVPSTAGDKEPDRAAGKNK